MSSSPPTSVIERLVLPFSSAKILNFTILSTNFGSMSAVSVSHAPKRIRKPFPIEPTILLSTVTSALFTRCITNFIINFLLKYFN